MRGKKKKNPWMKVLECGKVARGRACKFQLGWAEQGWEGLKGSPAGKGGSGYSLEPSGHPKSHPARGNWSSAGSCPGVQDKPNLILSLRLQVLGSVLGPLSTLEAGF